MYRRSLLVSAIALLAVSPAVRSQQPSPRTQMVTIDLNTATREQLLAFKGIGQAYADKIIAARPFKMRSELVGRHIMSATEYLKIKSQLLPKAEGPVAAEPAPPAGPNPDASGHLDINRATREQLLAIKGIGEAYADKIIAGRPYKMRSDLVKRNIIPASLYAKIKEQLVAKQ